MSERYVTVYRTYDPIQAEMLGDLLQQEGVPARVLGTRHGAAIGAGQNICQLHIEVPGDQAAGAAELIEAFVQAPPDDGEAAEADDLDGEAAAGAAGAPAAERPRSPLLAAGSTVAIFGGSHLYSRRPWTAVVIAAAEVGALVAVVQHGHRWTGLVAALMVLAAAVGYDLVGGQLAVRAYNRGARPGALRQLAAGIAVLSGLAALAFALAPHIPQPRRDDAFEAWPIELAPAVQRLPLDLTLDLPLPAP